MPNPQMPNIPGAAVMNDTLDFVKNLWGSMSVPGLTAPTLSVDELDKKINDLKAAEAWLTLNMSMLRGSIQALEVQRGTIATLKSVGASLAAAVNTGASDKSLFDSHPYASAFFQHAAPATVKAAAAAAPAEAPKPAAEEKPAEQATAASKAADDMAQMANPAMWWNLLQEQFKQAVATAMAPEAMSSAAAAATDAAVKFAAAATSQATEAAAAMSKPAPAKASAQPAPAKAAARKAPARRAAGKPAKEE